MNASGDMRHSLLRTPGRSISSITRFPKERSLSLFQGKLDKRLI